MRFNSSVSTNKYNQFFLWVSSLRMSLRLILLFSCFIIALIPYTSASGPQSRDFYRILGLPRTATRDEIKKRYRELSKELHPDSNPKASPEKFLNIRDAHEVLSDPKAREIYDKFGEEGLDPNARQQHQQGGFPGGGPQFFQTGSGHSFFFTTSDNGDHPFESFFTNSGGGFGHREEPTDLFNSKSSSVVKIRQGNWESEVEDRDWVALINFYSPGCSHCVQSEASYESLAKSLKDIILVAAVNCRESRQLCHNLGIGEYPTVFFYKEKKRVSPLRYEGKLTEGAVKTWLNNQIEIEATILTISTFEKWIVTRPQFAKVIFVTDRKVVPFWFRLVAHEFKNRVSLGVLFLKTPDGNRLKETEFKFWEDKTHSSFLRKDVKYPILYQLSDIGNLHGIWIPLKTPSKTVLSLILSRIVVEKRSSLGIYNVNYNIDRVQELTYRRSLTGDCSPTDSQICFILLVKWVAEFKSSSIYQAIQTASSRYVNDAVKFLYVDISKQVKFGTAFGFQLTSDRCLVIPQPSRCSVPTFNSEGQICDDIITLNPECYRFIAYRPKRNKYKVMESTDEVDLNQLVDRFIDSVVNSGVPLSQNPVYIPQIIKV